MKTKYVVYFLGAMALLLLVFMWRGCAGCGKSKADKPSEPVTVVVPEVPGEVVVAPANPPAEVVDTSLLDEVRHYRGRYEHYKALSVALAERLAMLDSALADSTLSCEERTALLRRKLASMDEGLATGNGLIDELNGELAPKRDTGSETTAAYRFDYEINHFGSIMPGGFRYKIDVLPQAVQCPDCPTPAKDRRHSLSALVGLSHDRQKPIYALQYQQGGRRLYALWQVQWPAAAMGGVGWRW